VVSVKFVNYSAFSYVQYISYQVRTLTMMCVAGSIDGVHINRITTRIVAEGYNEVDIKSSINKLCNWGLIYNTIDENLFQSSEEEFVIGIDQIDATEGGCLVLTNCKHKTYSR